MADLHTKRVTLTDVQWEQLRQLAFENGFYSEAKAVRDAEIIAVTSHSKGARKE